MLQNAAASLAAQWQTQAVSSDGQYFLTDLGGANSSFALTYNLFADKLLQTNAIPASVSKARPLCCYLTQRACSSFMRRRPKLSTPRYRRLVVGPDCYRGSSLTRLPQMVYPSTAIFRGKPIPVRHLEPDICDSLSTFRISAWSMFAAAYTNDTGVQQGIVDQIWRRVSNNATNTGIFATYYQLGGASAPFGNAARSVRLAFR